MPAPSDEVVSAMEFRSRRATRTGSSSCGGKRRWISSIRLAACAARRAVVVHRLENLPPGLLGVEIRRPDGRTDLVVGAEKSGTFRIAGQEFQGQVALVCKAAGGRARIVDVAE